MEDVARKSFGLPKPVSIGDRIAVTIENVGGQGDGIGKLDGFIIFVKGARKGEKCRVKIIDVKRTYAVGEKISTSEAEERMDDEVEGSKGGPSG